MEEFYRNIYEAISIVSEQYGIKNLISIQKKYDEKDYCPRLANFSFFNKIFDTRSYHSLYEIQGLSCQLHFGLANCFLIREIISHKRGEPNGYNPRYTFMTEATIHSIYVYWNRVGLVLNT